MGQRLGPCGEEGCQTRKGHRELLGWRWGRSGLVLGTRQVGLILQTFKLHIYEDCTFLCVRCTSIKVSKNLKRKSETSRPKWHAAAWSRFSVTFVTVWTKNHRKYFTTIKVSRLFNGETMVSATNDAGTTHIHRQKNGAKTPTSYHTQASLKMDSWSQEIKLQKLFRENTGVNFHDLGFSSWLLSMTPKSRATEGKK